MSYEPDWFDELVQEAAAQQEIERFWNACIEEFAGDPDED